MMLEEELKKFRKVLGNVDAEENEKKVKGMVEKILGLKVFDVLKERYQLGLLYRVKPEWSEVKHTRYDHTVGVVAKCIVVSDLINKQSKQRIEEKIASLEEKAAAESDATEKEKLLEKIDTLKAEMGYGLNVRDVKELAIAAAIHDCGHLPICHASERALLSLNERKSGITHEERIIPLLLDENEYFKELRTMILDDPDLGPSKDSFYRIICLISPEQGRKLTKGLEDFKWPKRAASQLLSSELDMDRLDYIIRDASSLYYNPVLQLSVFQKFVLGLTYEKTHIIDREKYPDDNIELCLSESFLQYAFYMLVARVLLYHNIYFSKELRSFEGTLTYLLGELLNQKVFLDFMSMVFMPDQYFIDHYLDDRIRQVLDKEIKEELTKLVEVLKTNKVGRFKYCESSSLKSGDIKNPRLRREFKNKLRSREYVETLRDLIFQIARQQDQTLKIKKRYLLFDVFNLKTGGGDYLVRCIKEKKDGEEENLKTLEDYMNGSNMHRLCTEERLDVYLYADLSDGVKNVLRKSVDKFCTR